MLQCMNDKERKELLGVLKYIEDTLLKNWNGYGGFEELQEKILRLRMILEETDGKATAQGDGYSKLRGFALIIGSLSLTTFIPNQFETILFYPQYSKLYFNEKPDNYVIIKTNAEL